ncbi:MAG: hypothetical protein WAX04_00055 [Oscillospiraceae bacterium]
MSPLDQTLVNEVEVSGQTPYDPDTSGQGCEDINYDAQDMLNAQKADQELQEIFNYLTDNTLPAETSRARRVILESPHFFIDKTTGLLYHCRQRRSKQPKCTEEKLESQLVKYQNLKFKNY